MQRFYCDARGPREKLDAIGLVWTANGDGWNEDAFYAFTAAEIDEIEDATNQLHRMSLQAVEYVITHKLYSALAIPDFAASLIEQSWRSGSPFLYGRFDLMYDGLRTPKLLEYNADSPTALLEASVAQWQWLEDLHGTEDQFNSIHEALVERWKELAPSLPGRQVDFCSIDDLEDGVTTGYLLWSFDQSLPGERNRMAF